ncbi:hypothetical protein DFH11DRAFT_1545300 [Phellopilus nigrolimitatus]|nr:hypothetical protein DFH11DRAFT_1545300 [Phellopilus nigrolimitatus]
MSDIPRGPVATALAIAEIQLQIFSLIEKSDSARCARVCRRWQKAALDRVWSSVDSLVFLVQLLAPLRLEPVSRNPLKFSRTITAQDWEKFMPYARRVRHLEIRLSETRSTRLDNSVFIELARCRKILPILPNLSSLKVEWLYLCGREGWPNHIFLFLHGGIQSLDLRIGVIEEGDQPLDILFDDITERAPLISEFTIHVGSVTENESSISKLLSRLVYLKTFTLDPFSPSQTMLNALASLQNLQTVQLISDIGAYSSTKFQKLNADGAFPRLKSIPLYCDLESVCLLLGSPNAFKNLLELDLRNADIHKENTCELVHLYSLFNLIPRVCLLFRRLAVKGNTWSRVQDDPIQAENLRPLTLLSQLEMLKLDLAHPIDVTNNQLVDIFGKCNSLTTLVLNTRPLVMRFSPSLTLDVLQLLSENCPQLIELGLYVDARVIPNTPDLLHARGFRNLQVLDLGASPIYDSGNVSLYLSRIIPSQCTFVISWSGGAQGRKTEGFIERWREVEKDVSVAFSSTRNLPSKLKLTIEMSEHDKCNPMETPRACWNSGSDWCTEPLYLCCARKQRPATLMNIFVKYEIVLRAGRCLQRRGPVDLRRDKTWSPGRGLVSGCRAAIVEINSRNNPHAAGRKELLGNMRLRPSDRRSVFQVTRRSPERLGAIGTPSEIMIDATEASPRKLFEGLVDGMHEALQPELTLQDGFGRSGSGTETRASTGKGTSARQLVKTDYTWVSLNKENVQTTGFTTTYSRKGSSDTFSITS